MSIVTGFINHSQLAFLSDEAVDAKYTSNGAPIQKNALQKWGGRSVWPTYEAPKYLRNALSNAKVLTVLFTGMGLYFNSLAFYPSRTIDLTARALRQISRILPHVKFPTYVFVCSQIVGLGVRSYGRFGNGTLMHQFDNRYPNPADQ